MPTAIKNEATRLTDIISAAFAADHTAPPCFNWTACGQPATVEKAGRSVCRSCAAALRGTEYPLRKPTPEFLYASGRLAAEALDMLEQQPEPGAARLDRAETPSDDPQLY
jgi:hypothetical protein